MAGEPRTVTLHRYDQGQIPERSEPIRFSHYPAPTAVFHEQFVDLTENNAFGGHGPTQQSEPRIRISGSTSTLASQCDSYAQIVRVRYA